MPKTLKSTLVTSFGVLLTAVAVSMFFLPNKIVCGGVSGISTVMYYISKLPPGMSFAMINIVLLVFGYKILGRKFVVKTLLGAGLLSVMVQLLSYVPPVTNNVFLASVFGGILYGFGIGTTFISGASTGGTDIIGRLIQSKYPFIPIGKLLMIVDGIVITLALIVIKKVCLALFGIFTLLIESFSIDWLIRKLNISKVAFVITNKGDDITEYLINISKRGVTLVDVTGGYTMSPKKCFFVH